jgi:hypothetical protein
VAADTPWQGLPPFSHAPIFIQSTHYSPIWSH